jgi:pimeloyl-ACP methyl ester carboxylesterase
VVFVHGGSNAGSSWARLATRLPGFRGLPLGWPVGAPIAHVPMVMRIAAIRPLGCVMAALPPTERSVRSMLRQVGLHRAIDTGRFSSEELAWFHALLRDTDTMGNEVRANRYLSVRHGLFGGPIIPDEVLASIRTPLVLLWGEEDPFGGAPIARHLMARNPGSQLELVAEAGHAVWVDEPDHTAAAIARFLGTREVDEPPAQPPPDAAAVRHGTRGATAGRDARGGQGSGEA